jgi:hypothetical protein
MDYFVIMVTMASLFFGLLFFVDKFPDQNTKNIVEYIAFFVLVGSTIIVIGMILWDARTRKKHDQKKLRALNKHRIKDKERDDHRLKVIFDVHHLDTSFDQSYKSDNHQNIFGNLDVPWDVDYQYKPLNFITDSESPEDGYTHMNEIFSDLLSLQRFRKNIFSLEKKGLKTGLKVVRKINKITKSNTFVENQDIQVDVEVKKIEKEIKSRTASFFRGSSNNLDRERNIKRVESSIKLVPTKKLGEQSMVSIPQLQQVPTPTLRLPMNESVERTMNESNPILEAKLRRKKLKEEQQELDRKNRFKSTK